MTYWKPLPTSRQEPPFIHGRLKQSSVSRSQVVPLKPSGHKHVKDPLPVFWHTPPFSQGLCRVQNCRSETENTNQCKGHSFVFVYLIMIIYNYISLLANIIMNCKMLGSVTLYCVSAHLLQDKYIPSTGIRHDLWYILIETHLRTDNSFMFYFHWRLFYRCVYVMPSNSLTGVHYFIQDIESDENHVFRLHGEIVSLM